MHAWFVPPSRFAFLSARKSCTCQLTPNAVWSCLDTVRFYCFFLLFPHENVCQPSFLQSKLRSITARLSHLQTVIDGQKKSTSLGQNVETPIGHERLHTTVGILAVGVRRSLVEDSMSWQRVTLQTNTQRGSVARDVFFAHITYPDTLPG